ncbi:DUF551 domain-containing protein [Clostridium aminobutyricum]|uniref:DUF551 domain-containing protein n=1 Tax=Clostridium aminobutyricum TaxID=33953 RepID=A0A939IGS4_CLOAM|nr:DUF551 domain-containing protein [Clostridium aminobutyricum]MBN7773830.1 DUF551 domain-containing protein [Clostridium aminobutyricum]
MREVQNTIEILNRVLGDLYSTSIKVIVPKKEKEEAHVAISAAIEALIEANENWIPCSERLPESGERVLFSTETFVGEGFIDLSGEWRRDGLLLGKLYGDIIAWRPLSKPYKELIE